eukprot:2284709-Rhodomonas_salina.11
MAYGATDHVLARPYAVRGKLHACHTDEYPVLKCRPVVLSCECHLQCPVLTYRIAVSAHASHTQCPVLADCMVLSACAGDMQCAVVWSYRSGNDTARGDTSTRRKNCGSTRKKDPASCISLLTGVLAGLYALGWLASPESGRSFLCCAVWRAEEEKAAAAEAAAKAEEKKKKGKKGCVAIREGRRSSACEEDRGRGQGNLLHFCYALSGADVGCDVLCGVRRCRRLWFALRGPVLT